MDISESELVWVVACATVAVLVIGWRPIATAFALLREQRALGKLYWHWRTLLDVRRRGRP